MKNFNKMRLPLILAISLIFVSPLAYLLAWTPFIQPLTFSKHEKYFFGEIENNISKGKSLIKVSDLTDFDWDTVCLFYGYDSPTPIDVLKQNGVVDVSIEHQRSLKSIEKKSDIRMVVFASGNRTTEIIYHTGNELKYNGEIFSLYVKGTNCVNSQFAILQEQSSSHHKRNHKNFILTYQ